MCGISGFFSVSRRFSEEDLRQMTDKLSHRGPDAKGYEIHGPAGLGHRRLSIIDLSESADQPMTSHDGRYTIAYNGETYNFRELAKRYFDEEERISLRSTSDTEIVLEGFAKMGVAFFREMLGMFAFALFDKQTDSLYIVRDRLGIKPLYYYWDGNEFLFASELKSLKSVRSLNLQIRKRSVLEYLHLGYIPAPFSIYQNVFKLESGAYLKVSEKGISNHSYWDIRDKISPTIISDEKQALEELEKLLLSSVEYRMYSDVPLGVFLSGGIDSSVVAATASQLSPSKIKTYSIGFKETTYDESPFAKNVADHLNTEHHEFTVTMNEAKELLPDLASDFDEPFSDSSAIPTMMVSRLARQDVKVTLSGDGGDELFFGYGAHIWAQRLQRKRFKLLRKPASVVFSHLSGRYKRVAGLLDYDRETDLASHIFSQEQLLFSRKEIESICDIDSFADSALDPSSWGVMVNNKIENQFSDVQRKLRPEEAQALFDLEYYLQDDLLVKVDRSSMKYSLETRVPLLDHRLVEFALNLDPALKLKGNTGKYLLKQYLYKHVPESYFERPKKGFSIPLHNWLQGDLSYLIDEHLSEESITSAGLIKYNAVTELLSRYRSGEDFLFNRIWQLIVLHQWLESAS